MGKKGTLIILSVFVGLAIYFGIIIVESINIFFSWILIGLWLLYSIEFFKKIKKFKVYNSPHNTSFFIFTPLLIGFLYNFWTLYDGILNYDLLGNSILYLTPWMIFFAFPYLIYGVSIIRSCFKKFDLVYFTRDKSVNSRKFGIWYIILLFIFIILGLFYQRNIVNFFSFMILPSYNYPLFYSTLIILMLFILLPYLLIRHGLFGNRASIPQLTSDYIAQRRRRIERVSNPPITVSSRNQTSSTRSRSRPSRSHSRTPSQSKTTKPRATTSSYSTTTKSKSSGYSRSKPQTQKTQTSADFNKLRPKAGILSIEDFKCIFCFQLPSIEDGRAVILCPNCKHPAHVNEFKDWLKSSKLCSRCDASIPLSFQQNPKIIPIQRYVNIIGEFKRQKR